MKYRGGERKDSSFRKDRAFQALFQHYSQRAFPPASEAGPITPLTDSWRHYGTDRKGVPKVTPLNDKTKSVLCFLTSTRLLSLLSSTGMFKGTQTL
jgi:hypothetical protein